MDKLEKSVFVIKPEALPYKEKIMDMIEKAGIPITEWRNLRLTESHLRILYPTITGETWHKMKKYLLNKEVLAAVVEGNDIVQKLYEICGDKTKPFLCRPDSIRYLFKNIARQNEAFSQNIIHRPKNKQEAEEHVVLFFPPERK
ncbi:MAG: nucleoside-diphosphate kinase [Minisyncoccia bacterium]